MTGAELCSIIRAVEQTVGEFLRTVFPCRKFKSRMSGSFAQGLAGVSPAVVRIAYVFVLKIFSKECGQI